MKYEELYNEFVSLFPDDYDYFKGKEKETGADVSEGIHVLFGMVVVPYIVKVLKESPDKAKKAFLFFEEMEVAEDSKVAEVLEFTVLEHLLTDDADVALECKSYFGEETKKAAEAVGRWYR